MRKILVVCVLLLCTNSQGAAVKFSGQRELFSAERLTSDMAIKPVWSARMNPAGTHVIYPVLISDPNDKKQLYDLEVFDLSDLSSSRIGISLSRGEQTIFTRFNFFDPSGSKLSVFRDKPSDANAPENRYGSGQTEVVIYDLKEKTLLPTGLYGSKEMGRFDYTGEWLFGLSGNLKVSLSDFNTQRMSLSGWIHSTSMNSEYATIFVVPRPVFKDGKVIRPERVTSLEIWNLTTNMKVTKLPVHPKNAKIDDIEAQWTGDGRYVYYIDMKEEDGKNSFLTRIWDVRANEEKPGIAEAIAVGPGPGESTMVMVDCHNKGVGEMFLHIADKNQIVPFGQSDMKLVHVWGDKIIYVQPDNGIDIVYEANIELIENANDKD